MVKVAAIQLPTLPMSESKIDYYLRACQREGVKIVVLGEYVLNSFFKEIENMTLSMVKEQSNYRISVLKKLSKKYGIVIIAPLILFKKEKKYKVIVKFSPHSIRYYYQNFLINYRHWDEESFFDNEIKKEIDSMTFVLDGVRFGVIFGFEIHFDHIWIKLFSKNVDCVLIPSVSTFNSLEKWNKILQTRAFLNGTYIIRVNRIGEYKDKNQIWEFYGNSSFICPDGHIDSYLGDKEEMLIADIFKKNAVYSKRIWGFRNQLIKRELI